MFNKPTSALALPRDFSSRPPTVLRRQTRQTVFAFNQFIFNMMSWAASWRGGNFIQKKYFYLFLKG
jgi:hypothetical protein